MKIRQARVPDAPAICELINYHAERGRMLHRSLEHVYGRLRGFYVAEDDGELVGCAAVEVFWADLAEVKSLAVAAGRQGQGVGSKLLATACRDARDLGVGKLFALTYETDFFSAHGFEVIDRGSLPEKVWRECIACPKADACDEVAMLKRL
jgi:amino-acid N-acetyltransferase